MNRTTNELLYRHSYVDELLAMIRRYIRNVSDHAATEQFLELIADYHENDIADALQQLSADERRLLYPVLGVRRLAEIIP